MRTSLWIVIVIVSGLVGFLMGYSVSSYTSSRSARPGAGEEVKASAPTTAPSADYGAAAPPTPGKGRAAGRGAHSGGYGGN